MSTGEIEELYRRHAGELHGYLHRRAGQAGADLLADVFVVALQRREDLPETDLRRAWLFGTARRLLLARFRDNGRRRSAEQERTHLDPAAEGLRQDDTERSRSVLLALESLREPDRELIRLTEWEGLSIAEAALVLGIRPGTARVRLHRARQSLAEHPALTALFEMPGR